jgi:predicted nucleic acid-binding protein
VTTGVKQALININDLSRQLLSCMLSGQEVSQEKTDTQEHPAAVNTVTDKELTELLSQREGLIRDLFEQNTTQDIALALTLVNEMLALDAELARKAQTCKQALAEQVLQLKKSVKVTQSYQEY